MATVIRNNIPIIKAAFFSRFLLINMFVFPRCGEMSSDVTSRIMAMTASHRLMSHKFSGTCTSRYISVILRMHSSLSDNEELYLFPVEPRSVKNYSNH